LDTKKSNTVITLEASACEDLMWLERADSDNNFRDGTPVIVRL
jgi:hypothetical protein